MSKFLVTGGAGFIGSNIAEHLVKQEHFVRVLDNFFTGKEENLAFAKNLSKDTFQLLNGDIRDKNMCAQACQGMDYVLMQAARRSVPRSFKEPEVYHDVNINGLLFMLEAAVQAGVKRFVFASSSSIYGDNEIFPQKEDQLSLLISPYALTKLAGEYYCRIFSSNYHLETVCLRYFNVLGPKQALDDEYAVVIPKFIQCLLADQPMPIFGSGEQSRDFTFIENVISANLLAATTPGIKHEVINVANGENHSILQLADTLNRIEGKNIKTSFFQKREGDIFKTHADISKAKKFLKYEPLVGFEEGLKKTVEYFKTTLN